MPIVRDVRLEDEDEGEAGAHHSEVEGRDVVDPAIGVDPAQYSGEVVEPSARQGAIGQSYKAGHLFR